MRIIKFILFSLLSVTCRSFSAGGSELISRLDRNLFSIRLILKDEDYSSCFITRIDMDKLYFDLDFSESTTLHLYSLYSRLVDDEVRNRLTFVFAGLDEDTVSDTRADFSEVEIERDGRARKKSSESLNLSFGSKTQLT
ncbi:MAG: hypothetical protein L3J12_03020, partial [Spirochaetales bacterium]|nr:hypothetical protein [Spirochaetales bacterium]